MGRATGIAWRRAKIAIVLMITASSGAASADAGHVEAKVSCGGKSVGITLSIKGRINDTTLEKVRNLFDEYHAQIRKIEKGAICDDSAKHAAVPDFSAYGSHYSINSSGGDIKAAMAIGRILRKERAWMAVDGVCYSACVFVLAGAVDRQIWNAGKVGIHRPFIVNASGRSIEEDRVARSYSALLRDMKDYLREMDVSEKLAHDMLLIPPESNRILSYSELKSYGLDGLVPSEIQRQAIRKETADVNEAAELGLSRIEYNRRKKLAETLCYATSAGRRADYFEFTKCQKRVLKTGIN